MSLPRMKIRELQLRDYGYYPGDITKTCSACLNPFEGGSRSSRCYDCASIYVEKMLKDVSND